MLAFLHGLHHKPDVVDLGCGDFNVGRHIRSACNQYVACDVVDSLIERNKRVFSESGVDFRCLDACEDPLPAGEVVFIRQVLQHLTNEQIQKVLGKLADYKYLVISEGVPRKEFTPNQDKPIGDGIRFKRSRKLNSGVVPTAPPFNLRPIAESVLCEALEGEAVIRTIAYQMK